MARMQRFALLFTAMATLGLDPVQANDSESELALGGLVLKQSGAITLDKEDRYVKKVGPTQFEIRKKNFEPANDIDILIINFGPFG